MSATELEGTAKQRKMKKKKNAEDTNWWETSGTNQDKRTLMQTSETTQQGVLLGPQFARSWGKMVIQGKDRKKANYLNGHLKSHANVPGQMY